MRDVEPRDLKTMKRRLQFSVRSMLLLITLSALGIVGFQMVSGVSLNRRLLNAMRDDRTTAIKFYLWLGADPNDGISGNSGYNWSPLQESANHGDATSVRHLIAAGANVNYFEKDGFTAIVYAAAEGHWEIVKMLYDAGADHRATGADSERVVDYAIAAGQTEIVEILTSDAFQPGFWKTETLVTPLNLDNDGLPYNRRLQVYPSPRPKPDQWPFLGGVRRYDAMVEQDTDGNERTVRGVVSLRIVEDQHWIEVTYADGTTRRVPL